jgi:hypothetical protein
MIVDPKGRLYGLPTLVVRQVLRNMDPDWRVTERDACRDLSEIEGHKLIEALLRDGLIEPCESWVTDDAPRYSRTEKGTRLALASARPIKRPTAERMLKALIERAQAINDGDYFCTVGALIVFGSFMTDAPMLGDLDVAWTLHKRFVPGSSLDEARRRSEKRAGKRAPGVLIAFWPYTECLLALKGHTPGLSLHDFLHDGSIVLQGAHEVVFGELTEIDVPFAGSQAV